MSFGETSAGAGYHAFKRTTFDRAAAGAGTLALGSDFGRPLLPYVGSHTGCR